MISTSSASAVFPQILDVTCGCDLRGFALNQLSGGSKAFVRLWRVNLTRSKRSKVRQGAKELSRESQNSDQRGQSLGQTLKKGVSRDSRMVTSVTDKLKGIEVTNEVRCGHKSMHNQRVTSRW